jgi:hypothetical protein
MDPNTFEFLIVHKSSNLLVNLYFLCALNSENLNLQHRCIVFSSGALQSQHCQDATSRVKKGLHQRPVVDKEPWKGPQMGRNYLKIIGKGSN